MYPSVRRTQSDERLKRARQIERRSTSPKITVGLQPKKIKNKKYEPLPIEQESQAKVMTPLTTIYITVFAA